MLMLGRAMAWPRLSKSRESGNVSFNPTILGVSPSFQGNADGSPLQGELAFQLLRMPHSHSLCSSGYQHSTKMPEIWLRASIPQLSGPVASPPSQEEVRTDLLLLMIILDTFRADGKDNSGYWGMRVFFKQVRSTCWGNSWFASDLWLYFFPL